MKNMFLLAVCFLLCGSTMFAQGKILKKDPLTGLPLLPASESAKKVGNEPSKMPDSAVCKSKMKGDFYKVYDYFSKDNITFADAIAWYGSHLSGFKKAEFSNHEQIIFYSADGTNLVIVNSQKTKDEEPKTSSVAYELYQPGLEEKAIVSMSQGHIVCK
jgi:hypothetical protein